MNAEPMTQKPTVAQLLAMEWSCDEGVCPPCGMNGEPQYLVWAFGDNGDGPHLICSCDTLAAAQAVVAAHQKAAAANAGQKVLV